MKKFFKKNVREKIKFYMEYDESTAQGNNEKRNQSLFLWVGVWNGDILLAHIRMLVQTPFREVKICFSWSK